MNVNDANELADELDKFSQLGGDIFFSYCADMLRQQTDRVGVLEANHKIQLNINDKAIKYIVELEKRNKELESFYRTVKALQE